jgi:predicted nuclease of predicted toxin-antitoxin system
MKLLLDQGIGRLTINHLASASILAEHVGDLGLARSPDPEILKAARVRQSVVVTMDADFHQHLAITRANSPSVIRIRIESLKSAEIAKLLIDVISRFEAELVAGAVVSVTQTSIRAKKLPIGG